MTKETIKLPFFIFNPKSYLYGEALLELAQVADQLAAEKEMTLMVTAPFTDLQTIRDQTEHIIVSAQHMDGLKPGRGMGHIFGESLQNIGVGATFLNHAEHPMPFAELVSAINRCKELDLISIVCADSLEEAQLLAHLGPDIILCEPTELIGTGQTSDEAYIESTNQAIKSIDDQVLVMQAAGISKAEDVYRTISLGAEGTGCTSGIVKADNPKAMLVEMVNAAYEAYHAKEEA
ncbi:triose-phosphate isomerase [Facklamia sp. DSM 111018]|uniref:Triose-phosphate isomerase n=1 Tax=Facklamia lactis TaxID=2749967 RepID=A0ABS0LSY7_9LACT|nr:triose-phosphate isomerase [Facklamia lactis]MBG9979391.1 triose-phosphate isomerase [Facklamia lactis]MBG9987266.1 triose-phosphate isomerase [Facklamia lactis]